MFRGIWLDTCGNIHGKASRKDGEKWPYIRALLMIREIKLTSQAILAFTHTADGHRGLNTPRGSRYDKVNNLNALNFEMQAWEHPDNKWKVEKIENAKYSGLNGTPMFFAAYKVKDLNDLGDDSDEDDDIEEDDEESDVPMEKPPDDEEQQQQAEDNNNVDNNNEDEDDDKDADATVAPGRKRKKRHLGKDVDDDE